MARILVVAWTHQDPLGGDACALWCLAIRHAVLGGEFGPLADFVTVLPPSRRGYWTEVIGSAEADPPTTFTPNGFVVTALQAAWSAIVRRRFRARIPRRI